MSETSYVLKPKEVETQVFDWGSIKWMSSPGIKGAQRFSLGVVLLQRGKGHLTHNHPDSEETLYVVSGEGDQMVADKRWKITAGDIIYIPKGIMHETINTGWEPLKLIAVYSPPGPEEFLKTLPECKIMPPETSK
ncbi:MAG: cupin domain-containing protein [Candidatus Bathyarchaeia archaeon]